MQYAGSTSKKAIDKPVQRLWLQSMTPPAIRDGFEQLRSDKQMLALADAARSRSEADWLVGINGTRAMTAFNSRDGGFFLTTVGRVQTPTLSIVVEREEDQEARLAAVLGSQGHVRGPGRPLRRQVVRPEVQEGRRRRPPRRPLWNERDAQAIAQACRGQPAAVSEEVQTEHPGQPAARTT